MEASIVIEGVLGNDLSVINAAKASFAKESKQIPLSERDRRLMRFLAEHGHTSPFRHCGLRLRLRTTLAQRIFWEGFDGNKAGMVFKPALADLLPNVRDLYTEELEWRWTASLQAAAYWAQKHRQHTELHVFAYHVIQALAQLFPEATKALTGDTLERPIPNEAVRPEIPEILIPALDKGYVRLVDYLTAPTDDEALLSLEIKAPLVVRSQWFKYRWNSEHTPPMFLPYPDESDGSGNGDDGSDSPMFARNEASGRYLILDEYYIPASDRWRGAPDNKKQGSKGIIPIEKGKMLTAMMEKAVEEARRRYAYALESGAAIEQARIFLPRDAKYTIWRWTANMTAVKFFLSQRLAPDAQSEIREYAQAVSEICRRIGM